MRRIRRMCQLPKGCRWVLVCVCVCECMWMVACAVDFISRPRTANSRAKQKLSQPAGNAGSIAKKGST